MAAVFESILRMSAVGSIVIIAVLIVRLCLKKAPKLYSYLLWAIVLLRLLCPFTVESAVSLIPDKLSSETAAGELSTDYIWPGTKLYPDESGFETAVDAGAEVYYTDTGDSYVNVSIGAPIPSPSSGLDLMTALAIIWLCGVAAMALWSIVGYIRLKHRLRGGHALRQWRLSQLQSGYALRFGLLSAKNLSPRGHIRRGMGIHSHA